ncbi:piggyBac transposable element-derived protein 4-like [Watersipora subatra]|uniref:piggyBac transposable element-derived protein 4-like n=1 Tax=Watersipora subatra TaxID=2589382 RepID=UPI00355C668E
MTKRLFNQSDIEEYLSSGEEGENIDSDEEQEYTQESESPESESEDEDEPVPQPALNPLDPNNHNFVRNSGLDSTIIPFTSQPGVKVRNIQGLTPFGYVKLFLTTAIIQTIVTETNRFGVSKHRDALVIIMGINKKPKTRSFRSTNPMHHMPIFGNTLSHNRFLRILSCLHFVDNETADANSPRLFKLGSIYNSIVFWFKAVYTPLINLSIDETLSHWHSRVSFRQYIPSKRARYGIKAYVLSESESGYVYNHHVYTGQEQNNAIANELSFTENIVF